MNRINIRVKEKIFIDRSPEFVWDYTQDFSKRLDWDKFLTEARILQEYPTRIALVKGKGRFSASLVYKQNERPHKTSLVFEDVSSPVIESGGGSWRYERQGDGTLWTQMGSCTLKKGLLIRLSAPLVKMTLRRNIRDAMKLAKNIMEQTTHQNL